MSDLDFGMKIVKHVKSNAIVVAKDKMAIGIGNGETNRIWPTEQAIERAGERIEGAVLASDAFFPFGDNIERAKKSGVAYIAEPGGSIRDDHVIMTCNKYNMAMAFTGIRLFHH